MPGRGNGTAKLIASKELGVALNSFIADDGFTAFADRVATAHTKCQCLGMPLTDLKTRSFFTGFRCSATASWTTLIENWQSGALVFDEILQRGRDHQAPLDLEKTTATARVCARPHYQAQARRTRATRRHDAQEFAGILMTSSYNNITSWHSAIII